MTEIRNLGTAKSTLDGTEIIPLQEAAGGASSTKRTTPRAIAALGTSWINVRSAPYNAVGDGVADDATAINAALTAAAGADASGAAGGVVYVPKGTYKINSQILVPGKVRLVGDNRSATYIIAGATFPTSTSLVRLGLGTGIVAGCTVEHMTIDANNIAGSICVSSTEIQEQSGAFFCSLSRYRDTGLAYDWPGSGTGPPNNASANNLEIYGSVSGSVRGIYVNNCGGKTMIENVTVFPNATASGACIHTKSSFLMLNGAHGEASTDLVYIESGFAADINGLYGQSTLSGALLHIGSSANATGIQARNLIRNNATHAVVDDRTSTTLDTSPLPAYPIPTTATAWDSIVKVSGSDVTTTGQTLVDVTGLTAALVANSTYEFEAVLYCKTSADTTGTQYGVNFDAAGASCVTTLFGQVTGTGTNGAANNVFNTANGTFLTTSGQVGFITVKGFVITGANAGNMTIQHKKVTSGTSTVKTGSLLKVRKT